MRTGWHFFTSKEEQRRALKAFALLPTGFDKSQVQRCGASRLTNWNPQAIGSYLHWLHVAGCEGMWNHSVFVCLFQMSLPFSNIFYGLFPRWRSEINPTNLFHISIWCGRFMDPLYLFSSTALDHFHINRGVERGWALLYVQNYEPISKERQSTILLHALVNLGQISDRLQPSLLILR